MRSYTDIIGIRNNAPSDIGPARLGVTWLHPGPPPSMGITVMLKTGAEHDYEVAWGGTFPVGAETWRFADVSFDSLDQWEVVVTRVDPNSPPWQLPPLTGKRVWLPVQLRPFGRLDEGQLRALETTLGRGLPATYRRWLAENNGAQPDGELHVPGLHFALIPERPLLGVHPQYPPFDLLNAERQRHRWLSEDYVVVAEPSGGLLAVKAARPGYDSVVFLPEYAMTGPGGADTAVAAERHLLHVADDFYQFLGRLQPIATPGAPPEPAPPPPPPPTTAPPPPGWHPGPPPLQVPSFPSATQAPPAE